jgi:hypothetical protein
MPSNLPSLEIVISTTAIPCKGLGRGVAKTRPADLAKTCFASSIRYCSGVRALEKTEDDELIEGPDGVAGEVDGTAVGDCGLVVGLVDGLGDVLRLEAQPETKAKAKMVTHSNDGEWLKEMF